VQTMRARLVERPLEPWNNAGETQWLLRQLS
jgi:hypothetical protein